MALVMWGEGYYVAACIFICRCGEEWRRGEIGWEMGGGSVHDEMMNSGMCVLGFRAVDGECATRLHVQVVYSREVE